MPGFGFSDKPRERGFGTELIAAVWTQLMARLCYTKYGTQGTDIGSGVGAQLAVVDAAHMAGLHLTGCGGAAPARDTDTPAYHFQQSTKPQTIGHRLSHSPVGLAAWSVD